MIAPRIPFAPDALAGRSILVTGGANGIGLACVKALVACGARVMIADQAAADCQRAAASVGVGQDTLTWVTCDVTDPVSTQQAVAQTVRSFGSLEGAINCAGISGGGQGPRQATHQHDPSLWRRIMAVNLDGVFHCMQSEIAVMIDKGRGVIINVASILGGVGFPGAAAYTASKHGVVGLTRAAALEYAHRGIRINAVGPGFIETAMTAPLLGVPAQRDAVTAMHPIGRLGTPDEIAALIVFLCTDGASFITGAYYLADGGFTAR